MYISYAYNTHMIHLVRPTQLLVKHGVPEHALDSQLTFQLEEVERLRQADSGTYAVLLAAAHQELEVRQDKATPRQEAAALRTPQSVSPVAGLFAAAEPLSNLKAVTRTLVDKYVVLLGLLQQ